MDIIIVARMGSSRLPGKTLEIVDNKNTMIGFLVSRLKKSKYFSRIIIATSDLDNDNVLSEWAKENNLNVFRGSSHNVLDRIHKCIIEFSVSDFVFILGDNPLIDYHILDHCIDIFKNNKKLDFLTTHSMEYSKNHISKNFFPVGIRVQIMNKKTIDSVVKKVKDDFNQEHSTSYIIENLDLFNTFFVTAINQFENYKLPYFNFAVNTFEQLLCIKKIISNFNREANFNLEDVIKFVNNNQSQFIDLKLKQ